MASPYLDFTELETLAMQGGYSQSPALSQMSAVFLLSACWFLQQRWIWQSPLLPISNAEWESIQAMIETAESDLMSNFKIGSLMPSICEQSSPILLLLDGQTVLQADYPDLADCVPSSWLSGANINLPDMSERGLFGSDSLANVGNFVGENSHTLTIGEMPSHTHTQNPHQHTEVIPSVVPTAAGLEPALASLVTPTPSTTGLTTATNNNTGNDESHNNIQASLNVLWYIVAR